MPFSSFQPSGLTALVQATSSSSLPTQVCTGNQQGMRVANSSTASLNCYIAVGQTSAVQAAIPTTTTPTAGMFLPALGEITIWSPSGGWLSAITTGGTAALFATPGFRQ